MFYSQEQYEEEVFSKLATHGEAAREYGINAGADHPDRCWILTPWDTWERNPFYSGAPQPHPEDNPHNEEENIFPGLGAIEEEEGFQVNDDGIPF